MTGPETTAVQEQSRFSQLIENKRNQAVGAVTLVALTVSGAIIASNGNDAEADATTAFSASEACDDISFGKPTEDLEQYAKTAFLPKNEVNSINKVKAEVTGKEGFFKTPLGHEMDVHSMAAVTSALTIPATDGKKAQSGYDYVAHYDKTLAALNGKNGKETAKEACGDAYKVMKQVATYNEEWATEGETVVKLEATRGKDSKIDCMTLVEVRVGKDGLDGIEFKNNAVTKGVDGFTSVLEDENGDLYVKGITVDNKDNDKNTSQKSGARGDSVSGNGNGKNGKSGGGCEGDCGEGGTTPKPPVKPPVRPPTHPPTTPPTTPPTHPPVKPPLECDPNIDVC